MVIQILKTAIFLFYSAILSTVILSGQPRDINFRTEFPDTLNRKGLAWVIGGHAAIYTGGLIFMNKSWYADRARVPFHFYNDTRGYLQIDKFGHATTAYV